MSFRWLCCLLLSTLAFGQAAAPPAQKSPSAKAPATQVAPKAVPKAPAAAPAEVAPNTPVITLNGICDTKAGQPKPAPAECKTVLTRAEFERLLFALSPQSAQAPPQVRQQAGTRIAQLMVIAHEAEKLGVQNRPEARELIRFAIMNAEAQELAHVLQEKYAHSSPEEIQKYYDANKQQFDTANLKRLIIPKPRPADGKPVDEAAFKASAEKIQKEAAGGGDFDKLQKEAFDAAEIKATPPSTAVSGAKLADMPDAHKSVFAMKPGEVSPLITDPSAFYIYRLESKQTQSLEQAKPDIEKQLQTEKIQKAAQEITNSVQPIFNPAYFGPAEAPPGQARVAPAPSGQAPAPAQKPPVPTKAPVPPPKQ